MFFKYLLFKKKADLPKRTKKLVYVDTKQNIGRTLVMLTDVDENKFQTYVYGNADQYANPGNDAYETPFNVRKLEEPNVSKVGIVTSRQRAQQYLGSINADMTMTVVDDVNNPSDSYSARFKRAEIIQDEDFTIPFSEARIEDA